jgi:hypothetical protein
LCQTSPCCPSEPLDHSCPCCPKKPAGQCPGGCAFCSVAKVPCFGVSIPTVGPGPCVGTSLVESCPPYASPFPGKLIRPPRA